MYVVLCDTQKLDVSKDFAGGMGVGQFHGFGGFRDKVIRHFYKRDHRPVALLFAHLAAVFRRLGHRVEYAVDRTVGGADLYVFNPSLITLQLERRAMARVLAENPGAKVIVVGLVASVMPQAFDQLNVTVVKGEAEQLLWKLEKILAHPGTVVQLGTIEDLDSLPLPDWSPFAPRRFRISYDFWRFPTALIQQSRGCTLRCNYCPYIILDNTVRFRDPEAVVDEISRGVDRWGFSSFKFRDPLFGLDRGRAFRLAELIAQLPKPIQFSVETRINLMPPELLMALRQAGLTSITVGIETPDNQILHRYSRVPVDDDRQHRFVELCRRLGIRTVAGFMIGFPDDTEQSIRAVFRYAKKINPTFANFNVVTPYPGTPFFEEIKDRIADFNFSHYTVYTPVLKYEHLSRERVAQLHGKCFRQYYFRWQYLGDNAHLLWPGLRWLGIGSARSDLSETEAAHPTPPRPMSGMDIIRASKDLRQDGPHNRSGIADDASGRNPAE